MADGLGVTVLPILLLRFLKLLPNPEVFCNLISLWIYKYLSLMKLRRLMLENIRSEVGRVYQSAIFPFWYMMVNPSVVI